jgi:hypothetical protein
MFVRNANAGATEAELLKRDELVHELMYFSRGDPVYYGDEQGFTGAGGRLGRAAGHVPVAGPAPVAGLQYNKLSDPIPGDDGAGKNDDIGSNATPMDDNFDPTHPLYRKLGELAEITSENPALRNGAEQVRYSTSSAGIYAFSRIDREQRYEYIVALNNSEQTASASIPTFVPDSKWERIYGDGPDVLRSGGDAHLSVAVAPLSTVVYVSKKKIPNSKAAPAVGLDVPAQGRDRLEVRADVAGDSFYEVTFLAKVGDGGLPRRLRHRARHHDPVPRRRPRQRRAHALERRGDLDRRAACDHARGAERGPTGAGHRRSQGDHDTGTLVLRRDVPAFGERRPVHADRHGRLVARIHRLGRQHRSRRRHPGHVPRGADVRAGSDRHEQHAHDHHRSGAGGDGTIHYNRPDGNYAAWAVEQCEGPPRGGPSLRIAMVGRPAPGASPTCP